MEWFLSLFLDRLEVGLYTSGLPKISFKLLFLVNRLLTFLLLISASDASSSCYSYNSAILSLGLSEGSWYDLFVIYFSPNMTSPWLFAELLLLWMWTIFALGPTSFFNANYEVYLRYLILALLSSSDSCPTTSSGCTLICLVSSDTLSLLSSIAFFFSCSLCATINS